MQRQKDIGSPRSPHVATPTHPGTCDVQKGKLSPDRVAALPEVVKNASEDEAVYWSMRDFEGKGQGPRVKGRVARIMAQGRLRHTDPLMLVCCFMYTYER